MSYGIIDKTLDCLADHSLIEEDTAGTSPTWRYRKWSSGKIEAWCKYEPSGTQNGTVWVSPMRYYDLTLSIPSGIFDEAPARAWVTGANAQWTVVGVSTMTTTSLNIRIMKPSSTAQAIALYVYVTRG